MAPHPPHPAFRPPEEVRGGEGSRPRAKAGPWAPSPNRPSPEEEQSHLLCTKMFARGNWGGGDWLVLIFLLFANPWPQPPPPPNQISRGFLGKQLPTEAGWNSLPTPPTAFVSAGRLLGVCRCRCKVRAPRSHREKQIHPRLAHILKMPGVGEGMPS